MPTKKNLYIVYCTAARPIFKDPATFHFLAYAGSMAEIEDVSEKQLAKLHAHKSDAFPVGTKIWIDEIAEIKEIPTEGLILNFQTILGDHGVIGSRCPLDSGDQHVTVYHLEPRDTAEREPLVILGEPRTSAAA